MAPAVHHHTSVGHYAALPLGNITPVLHEWRARHHTWHYRPRPPSCSSGLSSFSACSCRRTPLIRPRPTTDGAARTRLVMVTRPAPLSLHHTHGAARHAQDRRLTAATRGTGGGLSQVETGPQLACNGSRLTARTTHTILAWLVVARWPTSRVPPPPPPARPSPARATLADSFASLRTFRIVCLRLSLAPHPRLCPPRTTQLVRTEVAPPGR